MQQDLMKTMRLVRNVVLLIFVVITVVSAKNALVNAVFAIAFGGWVMTKLFETLFGASHESGEIPVYRFIPRPQSIMVDVLFKSTRKQALHIVIWWTSGILAAIVIYKLLTLLLISS
jgi:hypothetical protein